MAICHAQFIDHWGTTLQELDRTEDFYCNVLGGTVLRKRGLQITINLGPCPIAFFGDERRGLPYRPQDRGLPRGAFEIATEDFPKLMDRLRAASRSFEGPDSSDGDDAAHIWLHDPEGNYLEFVDRGTPKQHPEEIEFVRIDHVEYEDTDLNETADFYVGALGFDLAGRGLSPEGHPRLDVRLPTSQQVIRFYRVAEPSILLTETWHGHHLALHVLPHEYEATCRQLIEYGVILEREVHGQGDHQVVEHYFQDPHGHRFSIGTTRGERPGPAGSRHGV